MMTYGFNINRVDIYNSVVPLESPDDLLAATRHLQNVWCLQSYQVLTFNLILELSIPLYRNRILPLA